MPPRRRIDPVLGRAAVAAWMEGAQLTRPELATAVRYTLEELSLLAPGRSVEVRVPPYGAVQIISGTTHRRGTPPNVVEITADTWLKLVVGDLDWGAALDSGAVVASGTRAELSAYLPLVPRT